MSRTASILKPTMWLLTGATGLAFGQGHFPSGPALLLGMIAVVRYFRIAPPILGAAGFLAAHVLVWEWAYRGMVPLPTPARLGMEAGTSLLLALAFLLDRAVARRLSGFAATLALPAALVVLDFVSARLSPGGTWGSIAYTFADDAVLAQAASLFGWVTLTFLVGWIASAVNRVWDGGPTSDRARWGLGAVAGVVALLLVYGTVRLTATDGVENGTRAACIVAPSTYDAARIDDVWAYTRGVKRDEASRRRAIERIGESLEEHLLLTERAAGHGATIVLWPEVSASITASEERGWIDAVAPVARRHGVHVGMGLMVFRPETAEPSINKYLLVDPEGRVAMDFVKATRPPGAGHITGDGVLPALDLPFGRTTAAICFDLDFPRLIGQAGRMEADVLLAPSNDWPEVRATHARMVRFRAIEQGVTLLRPTRDGTSVIADACGRVIASLVLDDGGTGTLVADVPTARAGTLYSRIGDTFAWLCAVGLVLLVAAGLRSGPRDRHDGV